MILPLTPVMVNVWGPVGVVELVVTVRVEEPVPVIEVGLKVPVAPVGNPASSSAMLPVKPFKAVVETV